MPTIRSRQHPIVKRFRAAARGDDRVALVDGWHLLRDAVQAAAAIETVAIAGAPPDPASTRLLERISEAGGRVVSVSADVMRALSPVRTPSGVAALIDRRTSTIDAMLAAVPALVIVAADMQDPGNVGAVIRAAEGGGATGAVFVGTSADPWGWKALRAAMGSTLRLPVLRTPDTAGLLDAVEARGLTLVAAVPRAGTSMYDAELARPTALMLGGEGAGLPPWMSARAALRISIPMQPPVESLNVAVAAALLVYEARRQRRT